MLRTQVGRQTGVKFTPTLTFVPDEVPTTVESVETLLAAARDADDELRRVRAGASYAGDPDPYRMEATDEDGAAPATTGDGTTGDSSTGDGTIGHGTTGDGTTGDGTPGRVDGRGPSGQASGS